MSALPPGVVAVDLAEVEAAAARLERWLTPAERATFEGLAQPRRRLDWLGGRLAAKRAMQRATGLPVQRLEVVPIAGGPESGRPEPHLDGARLAGHLSIAHRAGLAVATLDALPVGLDLEVVEPREPSFLRLFLAPAEAEAAARDPTGLAGTRAWCALEAVAKWRGVGLREPFAALAAPAGLALDRGLVAHRGATLCWARARGPR